jgi:hypothetical protein
MRKNTRDMVEKVAYEITVAIVGSAAILLTVLVFK